MKKIAVLMSTFNGEKYIKEQIDSILGQKCEYKIDLIVRDDGSNDNTYDIVSSICNKSVILYKGENVGAGYGFLKLLIDNPGYDYYAFTDQDDYWYENKLQKAIDKISNVRNYALYCSNTEMCDSNLVPLGRNVHKNMSYYLENRVYLGLACAQGCTCVFNKKLADVIIEKGMPSNIVLHDSFLTCLCFALGGFFYADEWCSMKYRMHGNNVGGLITKSQAGVLTIIKKRIQYILTAPDKSVIDQLLYIINTYHNEITQQNHIKISDIVKSKQDITKRLSLVFSPSIKDESLNLSIANRFKILFGRY